MLQFAIWKMDGEACVGYRDLREFVARLEKEGELKRKKARLNWGLERLIIWTKGTASAIPCLLA